MEENRSRRNHAAVVEISSGWSIVYSGSWTTAGSSRRPWRRRKAEIRYSGNLEYHGGIWGTLPFKLKSTAYVFSPRQRTDCDQHNRRQVRLELVEGC